MRNQQFLKAAQPAKLDALIKKLNALLPKKQLYQLLKGNVGTLQFPFCPLSFLGQKLFASFTLINAK